MEPKIDPSMSRYIMYRHLPTSATPEVAQTAHSAVEPAPLEDKPKATRKPRKTSDPVEPVEPASEPEPVVDVVEEAPKEE